MSEPARLGVAVLGIGRMGRRHALNVAFFTPRARLVAVCDPVEACLEWAKENLPGSTSRLSKFQEVFDDPDVQAVIIATETSSHATLAIQALQAGKHVLLEKPISVDVDLSRPVVAASQAHPGLKIMVGLSRRFDESYKEVKRQIDTGLLGAPYMIKSTTADQYDPSGFFVKFSEASGGLILDCGIHDIDMARWLFGLTASSSTKSSTSQSGPSNRVKRVWATGLTARHPELAEHRDADNAICVVEFEGGKVLDFHLSRTGLHGHDCFTEVFGSERKVIVNGNPTLNRVEIRDAHGVRTESTPTYYERFREAFVAEVNEFVGCCLDDTAVPVSIDDAIQAAKIADALTYAFRSGKQVTFGEDGEAIYE